MFVVSMHSALSVFLPGLILLVGACGSAAGVDEVQGEVAHASPAVKNCPEGDSWKMTNSGLCWKPGGFISYYAGLEEAAFRADGEDVSIGVEPQDLVGLGEKPAETDGFWQAGLLRFKLDTRTDTDYGPFRGFLELQGELGYKISSPIVVRHAYVQLGRVLAGKTNSNFLEADFLPPTTSGLGLPGAPLLRVMQLRYTQPLLGGYSLSVSLEGHPGLDEGMNFRFADNLAQQGQFPTVVNARRKEMTPAVSVAWKYASEGDIAQVSLIGMRREISWKAPSVGASAQSKQVTAWGSLAGVKKSFEYHGGKYDYGAQVVYSSGLPPGVMSGVGPRKHARSFLLRGDDSVGGHDVVPLKIFSGFVWVNRAWTDRFSTSAGAAFSKMICNDDYFRKEANKDGIDTKIDSPVFGKALFLHADFDFAENFNIGADLLYGVKQWGSGASEQRTAAAGIVQLTRFF